MAGQKVTLTLDANLNISQVKQAIGNFQSSLDSLKLPAGILTPVAKDLAKLQNELKNFEALSSKKQFDKTDANALASSYEKISTLISKLNIDVKGMQNLDLSKLLPPESLARFEKLSGLLTQIANVEGLKSNLDAQIKDLSADAENLTKRIEELRNKLQSLQTTQTTNGSNKDAAESKRKTLEAQIKSIEKAQAGLVKSGQGVESRLTKVNKELTEAVARANTLKSKISNLSAQTQRGVTRGQSGEIDPNNTNTQNNKIAQLEQARIAYENLIAKIRELRQEQAQLQGQPTDATKTQEYQNLQTQLEQLNQQLQEVIQSEEQYKAAISSTKKDITRTSSELTKYENDLAKVKQKLTELTNADIDGTKLQAIRQALAEITQQDISKIPTDLNLLKQIIDNLQAGQLEEVKRKFEELARAANKAGEESEGLGGKVKKFGDDIDDMDSRMGEVDMLKRRIQYFFGLNNAINLIKRTMREAFNTVKALDKAMTETAVVTKFSVGDMWAQLPEYTKRANELGVTTQAAYEAATLYYQQGLSTNEVMAMSNETLKMARIAGLDAAEATDRMTNAIRGFNMEINTMNAQRIDDVYSRLAAISASNVDEISTAMTKVASLAHNANMEFETTAAFLAQIIETTRESAETAGTALKTVVARFSEVKKLVDENQLRGTDEEGQEINVNKVSEALRTAGIDLNKYFLGEVGLDDIFMELASKWDSLSTLQQRYIATQAAGSRQQSRFIALMSDYARTQELVGEAYEANGASAKQFEKTQDSLESKLAKLKNAWNEFAMGILNSDLIKVGVETLTNILKFVNDLTSGFGTLKTGVGGVISSLSKLFLLLGLLNVGRGLTAGLIGSVIGTTGGGAAGGAAAAGTAGGAAALGFKATAARAMFGTAQAGAMSNMGMLPMLGMGFLNPVASVGKGLNKIWTGAKIAGAAKLGLGTFSADAAGTLLTGEIGLAAGLTGLLPVLGSLLGIAVVLGGIYAAWYNWSPEGKLKKAQKAAEDASKALQKAEDKQKSISSFQETYDEQTEKVNAATTTEERSEAIQSRNEAILNAIKENPDYSEYVDTNFTTTGELVLTLNEEKVTAAAIEAAKEATRASISSYIAQAEVYSREAAIEQNKVVITDSYQQALEGLNNAQWGTDYGAAGAYYAGIYLGQRIFGNTTEADQLNSIAEVQKKTELARKQIELAYASMVDLSDTDLASELEGNLAKTLSQIYQQTGEVLSEDVFESLLNGLASGDINSDIFTDNIDFSLGQINLDTQQGFANFLNQIGVTVADLDDFSEAIGAETDTIKTVLKARAKEIQIIQTQARGRVFQKLFEAGMTLDTATQNQINKLAPDEVDQIYTALENAQNILSPENFASFAPSLLSSVGTGLFNEIGELFSSINLDDPIGAFNNLATAEKTASGSLKTYITQIRESNQELFTATGLVQSFILSADYEELTDSLSDFIEENGQISSKNIEDLAKSNQKLKQLLDTEQISAKALARALTLVEQGKLSFDNITESIINALEAGESFEEVISNVNQWIEDFNEGTDLAEGTDHIVSELETLKEYVSNWEFGNKPTQKIYDHIFGDGAYAAYMHEDWGKKSFDQLESDLLGQIEHISGLAENEGLGALQTLSGNLTGLQAEADGLTFHWDLSSFTSTGEAIDEVATKLGVSQEVAEAFIESWGSHMWDLREDWNKLNYKEQLTTFTNSLGNAKVITQQELTALGAIVGKSADEVLKDLEELAKANNIDIPVVVNWQDENGAPLTEENLFDKFKETFGEDTFSELSKQFGGEHIDAEGLFTELTSHGLSQGQAEQIANKVTSQIDGAMLKKTIQIPEYSFGENGITVTQKDVDVKADTWAGLTQAEDAALEAAKYDLIGQNIANQDVSSLGDNISRAIISGTETGSAAMVETIRQALAKENFVINVSPKVSGGAARASGGLVKSFSKGSASNSLQPGPALTGEEGREIVWNKQRGYAYVTGENGPQFQNLQPGDRVFNAAETSRIFRNSSLAKGGLIDSFARGGWKEGDSDSGGGGNSDDDKAKEDKWKNEIDWLYNLVEDIAELERIQTKLQEEYDDYLKDQTKNGKDLYNLLIKQLGNLYTQLDHQTYALEQREREMREFMDTTNQYDQYLSYNWADRTLEIDWDGIEALQDKDTYNEIKDLISEAESIQDKMDDAEDAVQDIRNQIEDLENIWRETYTDFEERVSDALVKSYQTVIDNYSELNDTLSDSNSQILNALQKQISLERQIRDNTKTEEDIADQEARLAFLRRDTTGGNELSALQLSSQLDESRQSYEDNLIDQAISKLQEDNDEAAQQRQKQIEIMQAQLDYQQQSGEFNAAVRELLENAMGADGQLLTDSELMKLLKEQENWAAMSDVSKSVWEEELNGTFKEVAAFILKQNAQENGTYITALTAAIGGISSTIGSYSQALTKISSGSGNSGGSSGGGGSTTSISKTSPKTTEYGITKRGNFGYSVTADGVPISTTHQGGSYSQIQEDLKKLRGYATGGLNTKTGPAWLDGTPSEPEYVLNARQTDAFLKLADVLPAFMANNSTSTTTFGGINLNLVMNVDQIASDYDVDRIADRVKSIIYDAGSYRNVNTLNFSR